MKDRKDYRMEIRLTEKQCKQVEILTRKLKFKDRTETVTHCVTQYIRGVFENKKVLEELIPMPAFVKIEGDGKVYKDDASQGV